MDINRTYSLAPVKASPYPPPKSAAISQWEDVSSTSQSAAETPRLQIPKKDVQALVHVL
jgi:hypothetical protein